MTKIVCITGMHRSGTSLTTSWLQKCGLPIHNGKLIRAAVGNPHGHFEDQEFVDFHIKFLEKELPNSKGWVVTEPFEITNQDELNTIARSLIADRNEFMDIWGWKDPRTVLFLDHWKEHIPDLKFIFVWRPTHEVVNSLVKRSRKATHPYFKITRSKAYKVWRYYNMELLRFFAENQENSVLLSIDDVMSRNLKMFELIETKFDIGMEYFDIGKLVDTNLMDHKAPGRINSFFEKRNGVEQIEYQLREQSLN